MVDGIPDAGLRGEVEHDVGRFRGKCAAQAIEIADVEFAGGKARLPLKQRRAVALQLHAVIAAEVVDSDDIPSAPEEFPRRVEAYESGKACD